MLTHGEEHDRSTHANSQHTITDRDEFPIDQEIAEGVPTSSSFLGLVFTWITTKIHGEPTDPMPLPLRGFSISDNDNSVYPASPLIAQLRTQQNLPPTTPSSQAALENAIQLVPPLPVGRDFEPLTDDYVHPLSPSSSSTISRNTTLSRNTTTSKNTTVSRSSRIPRTFSEYLSRGSDTFEAIQVQPDERLRRLWETMLEDSLRKRLKDLHLSPNDICVFELRMMGPQPVMSQMKPTILVICSRSCSGLKRKKIELDLRKYITSIDIQHLVEVKVLAAEENGRGTIKLCSQPRGSPLRPGDKSSLPVEADLGLSIGSLMGCTARICSNSNLFTIGGIICVGRNLYALTVAHPMFADPGDLPESADIAAQPSLENRFTMFGKIEAYEWSGNEDDSNSESLTKTASNGDSYTAMDWALIDIMDGFSLGNTVVDRHGLGAEGHISGFLATKEIVDGEVRLCTGHSSGFQSGVVSSTSVLMMVGRVAYDVRSIALDSPLEDGDSGSWVIQGEKACGCIFARVEGVPYAYMLPIGPILERIQQIYSKDGPVKVDVPDAATIKRLRQHVQKTKDTDKNTPSSPAVFGYGDHILSNVELLFPPHPSPVNPDLQKRSILHRDEDISLLPLLARASSLGIENGPTEESIPPMEVDLEDGIHGRSVARPLRMAVWKWQQLHATVLSRMFHTWHSIQVNWSATSLHPIIKRLWAGYSTRRNFLRLGFILVATGLTSAVIWFLSLRDIPVFAKILPSVGIIVISLFAILVNRPIFIPRWPLNTNEGSIRLPSESDRNWSRFQDVSARDWPVPDV